MERDLIVKEKVENTGLFDFSGLYSYAYGWFKYEEYVVVEDEYTEKVSGNEREAVIKWSAWKTITDYFKLEIKVKFEIRNMTEVEVEIDGKKKKMNKGRVITEIKGSLVRDPESGWEGKPWYKFFRETYDKYIIPKRVEDQKEKVMSDVWAFKDALKGYLDLIGKR